MILKAHTYWLRGVTVNGVYLGTGAIKKARKQLHGAPIYSDKTALGNPTAVVGRVIMHGDTPFVEINNPQVASAVQKRQRLALQVNARYWEDGEQGNKVIPRRALVLVRAFLAPNTSDHPAFVEIPSFEETAE